MIFFPLIYHCKCFCLAWSAWEEWTAQCVTEI